MTRQRRSSFKSSSKKRKRVNVFVFAEILKKRMTPAEKKLEQQLKLRLPEWLFESQVVVAGRFIADFVCRSNRLIIEVDGSIHRIPRVKRKDAYRTSVLLRLGYVIIRFNNKEVLTDCTRVVEKIRNKLQY